MALASTSRHLNIKDFLTLKVSQKEGNKNGNETIPLKKR